MSIQDIERPNLSSSFNYDNSLWSTSAYWHALPELLNGCQKNFVSFQLKEYVRFCFGFGSFPISKGCRMRTCNGTLSSTLIHKEVQCKQCHSAFQSQLYIWLLSHVIDPWIPEHFCGFSNIPVSRYIAITYLMTYFLLISVNYLLWSCSDPQITHMSALKI